MKRARRPSVSSGRRGRPRRSKSTSRGMADKDTFSIQGKALKLTSREDAVPVAALIDSAPASITSLRLTGNTIGIDAAEELARAIKTKKNLKSIFLDDIFTGRGKEELGPALRHLGDAVATLPSVTELDLSDNALSFSINDVTDLISRTATLEILRLHNCGLGPQGGSVLAGCLKRLAEASKGSPRLKVLVAGRDRLENGAAVPLSGALPLLAPSLSEFRIPQNGIRWEGMRALIPALGKCTNLEHIDINDNLLTSKGGKLLAAQLPKWPRLRVLNIGDTLPHRSGSAAILAALSDPAVCPNLVELHLAYASLDDELAKVLAGIIRSRKVAWKRIDADGNHFPEDGPGADAIRAALEEVDADVEEVLGSLDDNDDEQSDEEEEGEDEEGEEEGEEETEAADELEKAMGKLSVSNGAAR